MRELKFRAWIYKNSGETSITQRMVYSQGDLEAFFEQAEMWVDTPIMQFTGLHDKNGKEIYEGDVIRNAHLETGVVEYDTDRYRWDHGQDWGEIEVEWDGIKVIGNIYEDSHLLE